MANKTVIRLDMKGCHKCEKIALQSVTKIEGIHKLSIEMEDCTLTVIGEADPVFVAKKLRRKFKCVEIVSVEPMPLPQLALAAPETGKNGGSSHKEKSDKSINVEPMPLPQLALAAPETGKNGGSSQKEKSDKSINGGRSTKSNGDPPTKPPPPAQPEPKPEPEPKPKPEPPCICICPTCICICPTCTRYTPEIMWPQYHNPFAPDEVWYVWKEDQQESCTIM